MPITNKVVSSNPVHGEVYSIQHYVIKFVGYLRQVGGFLWVFRFPPPIKLYSWNIVESGVKYYKSKHKPIAFRRSENCMSSLLTKKEVIYIFYRQFIFVWKISKDIYFDKIFSIVSGRKYLYNVHRWRYWFRAKSFKTIAAQHEEESGSRSNVWTD